MTKVLGDLVMIACISYVQDVKMMGEQVPNKSRIHVSSYVK